MGYDSSANHAASHLAAIVEASEDAIISKTLEGRVLTWNAAAERLYGYSTAEAEGCQMSFLLPPDRPDEEQEIHVSLSISPIRDINGAIIGASHIARDITERKQAEARIRDSEATLRAFLED